MGKTYPKKGKQKEDILLQISKYPLFKSQKREFVSVDDGGGDGI